MHLAQAQNVHTTLELAAVEAICFSSTFLTNGSDERQWSGQIKAAGCWFESGVFRGLNLVWTTSFTAN